MADPVFGPEAIRTLAAGYPEQPMKLSHALTGHPMFDLEALAHGNILRVLRDTEA